MRRSRRTATGPAQEPGGPPTLDAAVERLIRAVDDVARRVDRLAQTVAALDGGTHATAAVLSRHLSVLTSLLLDRGLLDPVELQTAEELAVLRDMYARPSPEPGRRRGPRREGP